MRRLVEDKNFAAHIGARAAQDIHMQLSPEIIAAAFIKHFTRTDIE
jgi:hypothetical protein